MKIIKKLVMLIILAITFSSCSQTNNTQNNNNQSEETDWDAYFTKLDNLYKNTVTINTSNIELSDGTWILKKYRAEKYTENEIFWDRKDIEQIDWNVSNNNCTCIKFFNEDYGHANFLPGTDESKIQYYYNDALEWQAEIKAKDPDYNTIVYKKDNVVAAIVNYTYDNPTFIDPITVSEINQTYIPTSGENITIKRNNEKSVYIIKYSSQCMEGEDDSIPTTSYCAYYFIKQ